MARGHTDEAREEGLASLVQIWLSTSAKALNLTSEQQTQFKAMVEAAQAAEEPRHTRLQELRKQLEAVTANGQFDEAKVRAIANEQAQLMADVDGRARAF